ncbi:RNA polymerase sigma factor [Pseudidiomarina terrestris]|uniref:RNA polymerase sigma factor n=1 Tax=Pseudidiomarina terrestris TaxID=2820060 RepID=UPI00264E2A1D|nr:RNA polymerase sigma factor [Pseudidiomarina sp. 1ASP75-5]MDN7135231.1 RNA polymerase sigma factor [Pseudidiomarina sp. 1ASP75-5]
MALAAEHVSRMQMIEPHTRGAQRLAEQLLGCPQRAADVVQDATEKVLTTTHFPARQNAKAWFLQVVRHLCIDQLRRQRKHVDDDVLGSHRAPTEPLDSTLRETAGAVYEALAALPFELRDLIVLRELNECSYKEIAVIVGIAEGTVMSRLHKARLALRSEFKRRTGEDSDDYRS